VEALSGAAQLRDLPQLMGHLKTIVPEYSSGTPGEAGAEEAGAESRPPRRLALVN